MRVPKDFKGVTAEAPYGPSQPRTATLHALPTPCHHTVRSVAYRAYRTLWADEPDRAERWHRVSNMDQVFGIGRPLRTMSGDVIKAAIQEMEEMGMPEDVIMQHMDNFAALVLWAGDNGFFGWACRDEGVA